METIKIWNDNLTDAQAASLAARLKRGEIGIVPTDSVYALVCDALNVKAIAEVCRLKGIDPERSHLSAVCRDISMASEYAHIDDAGFGLLKRLAPGPYTFLFRASRHLPKAFKGRKTVGIRIPSDATPRKIAEALGHPVLTSSVEADDPDMLRSAGLIAEHYATRGVDFMVDGGDGDTEYSTVIDCTEPTPTVVRHGKGAFEI